VALDLTQAIIIGVGLSALIFVIQISQIKVVKSPVSAEKMREQGYDVQNDGDGMLVVYIIGPLFFGTVNTFNMAMDKLDGVQDLILSLRTVPLLDTTGLAALEALIHRMEASGGRVFLSGLNDPVQSYLERAGVIQHLGEKRVFWNAYEAIVVADYLRSEAPAAA